MQMPQFSPQPAQHQQLQPPRPRPPKRRFRWWWITVPLACAVVAYLLSTAIPPRFDWEDVMRALHVPSRAFGRYTRLCVLGLTLVTIVAVLRIARSRRSD
jgi:hypothetical protein